MPTPNNTLNITTKPKPPYKGWTIESHTPVGEVDLSKVVFHLEPEQKEGSIKGEVLRERLKGKKCLDGALLDYLFEHKELIPDSWKKDEEGNTRYIFFWGTIYRDFDGFLCIRYLCWNGGGWRWFLRWLDHDCRDLSPAALLQDLSTSTISTSLEKAIEQVKEAGYQVSKIL